MRLKVTFITMFVLGCINLHAQTFNLQYITEGQCNHKGDVAWANLLNLRMDVDLFKDRGQLQVSTLHAYGLGPSVATDYQVFSNIVTDNAWAMIAVLGYMHNFPNAHLFFGVRNTGEDFFVSDMTGYFTSSSCGIFPTITGNYPIATFPMAALNLYFDWTFGDFTLKNALYNGTGYCNWTKGDNPFVLDIQKDGLFNISQLEYSHSGTELFFGSAYHSKSKSLAWWLYGEQVLYNQGDNSLKMMVQYSENTDKEQVCPRYGQAGLMFQRGSNHFFTSLQYAKFWGDNELSLELSYKRDMCKNFALQPSLHLINNQFGLQPVLMFRLIFG